MTEQSVCKLQGLALKRAAVLLDKSAIVSDPKDAANWSLAAKNAASVATSCESILKIRNGGGR